MIRAAYYLISLTHTDSPAGKKDSSQNVYYDYNLRLWSANANEMMAVYNDTRYHAKFFVCVCDFSSSSHESIDDYGETVLMAIYDAEQSLYS